MASAAFEKEQGRKSAGYLQGALFVCSQRVTSDGNGEGIGQFFFVPGVSPRHTGGVGHLGRNES